MSADDQVFLDVLNSVGADVKRFSGEVATYIDRHVEQVAATLRKSLSSQQWLPDAVRPKSPPKPTKPPNIPLDYYARVNKWVLDNKVLTGTFVLGITATTLYFLTSRRRARGRKRRAKRAGNGARLEVVVISGSPSEPILRSLALDLERRGFIVFIVCSDVDEEVAVQNECRQDIRPLSLDVYQPGPSMERFSTYLQTPQHAFEGARAHHLIFSSLIILPSQSYPTAPLATISSAGLSDLINTRLLHPMLVTQAFLPLLAALPFPLPHHHSQPPPPNPKILLLTPTIISSLNPPFHILESTTTEALTTFSTSLRSELAPLGIPLYHFNLGGFDTSSFNTRNQLQSLHAHRAETLSWPTGSRELYAKNYLRMMGKNGSISGVKSGSPLRELHNAVFDAMEAEEGWWRLGGAVRVGQGSSIYPWVGKWIPRPFISWVMGMTAVQRTDVIETDLEDRMGGHATDSNDVPSS